MMSTNFRYVLAFVCSCAALCSTSEDISETSLVGSEFCGSGPSYWCNNFTAAIECNAVKHCIQTVWLVSKETLHDDKCSTCVDKVTELKNMINSDTTKEFIENAFDYECEATAVIHIPVTECKEKIHQYITFHINDLLDLLNSKVHPQLICKLLGLCNTPGTLSTAPSKAIEMDDEVVLQFDNIMLHFPSHDPLFGINFFAREEVAVEGFDNTNEQKLVGSSKCTWGPSYWCENLTNSKECHSTSHCINAVWTKQTFAEDSDDVCKICKDMVQQASDQLLSNETQDELRQVFEGSCKLIPIKPVKKDCIQLVDEFVPELTEMLASEMNPTAVCTVAGLCNSPRVDSLISEGTAIASAGQDNYKHKSFDTCTTCTATFTMYQFFMTQASTKNVLQKILAVCGELSSYSDICSALVQRNFDDLYSAMKNIRTFEGCHLTGMCPVDYLEYMTLTRDDVFRDRVNALISSSKTSDNVPCDLCKEFITYVKQALVANTTEDEFHQMLLYMCEQTGKFRDECVQLVNNNYHVVYVFLTEELDPQTFCQTVEVCPKPNALLANQYAAAKVNLATSVGDPVSDVSLGFLDPSKMANAECNTCLTVVTIAEKLITDDPKFANDVQYVLREVCNLVPPQEGPKCKHFVHTYLDTIFNLLKSKTDPKVVCSLGKICVDLTVSDKSPKILCPLCEYVLHYLQISLTSPTEEAKIVLELAKVCNYVPKVSRNECQEFVNTYSDLIIEVFAQDIDPSIVCPALKVCPALNEAQKCAHCRSLVSNFMKNLDRKSNLSEIQSRIDTILKPDRADNEKAKSAVAAELYFHHQDSLIDMVMAEFTSDESCVYLKYCSPNEIELHNP